MASSSSSLTSTTTPQPQGRYDYDVFLSFRGEDTRDNFVSHLYDALSRKQILTFIDNKELRRGKEISPSLLNAIEKSKISVIIFSENYASSKWCLEELTKILQCKKMNGQIVVPVFYRVDPSTVRNQTGSFADAFAKHEVLLKEKVDKVLNWKAALTEAANLSGWDSLVTRPETELINKLIEDILKKLNRMSQIILPKSLVGIESRIKEVESLLCMESVKVRSVGIWGMGGIGKTTIAEAVFCCICPQFEGFHFIANVREELKRDGIVSLWNKLLSKLLGEENLYMGTLSLRFTFIKERLGCKKVLIVFDDVDDSILEPLKELLVEKHDLLGPGSRILITSRDKQVLNNLVDEVYEVNGLNYNEALQLFFINAFKKKYPTNDQRILSNKVLNYASGNPLVIKVLGSTLLDKSKEDWDSALEKLEKMPKPGIMSILRISYDGLSCEEKNLFLDIACFFRGEDWDSVIKMLDSCHCCVCFNIRSLSDKSLITISHSNKLEIHDLLQEMGRRIVYDQCTTNPGKRTRLWDPKEVYDVLTQMKGTEVVESICLNLSESREMHLESEAFKGMNCLRLLKFYNFNWYTSSKKKVHLPHDGLRYLSNELRYFHWDAFPSKSLPQNFCVQNLVQLVLRASKLKQLWNGTQNLVNLKGIDLAWSKYLTEIPNLSKAKNIELIDLRACNSLVKLTSSIRYLDKLEWLSVSGCEDLRSVPRRIDSKFLRVLGLGNCPHVKKCPRISSENVTDLDLSGTAIKELPRSIHKFKALRYLSLSGSNITKFPKLSSSGNLEYLRLTETEIEEVPPSIGFLARLVMLDMSDNKKLSRIPNNICKLKSLRWLYLIDCPKLESFPEIFEPMESLEDLHLRNCPNLEIPSDLFWWTTSLKWLDLSGNYLERLPASFVIVNTLERLYLSNCKRLLSLPQLPVSLIYLRADDCESLETISTVHLSRRLRLVNCLRLDEKARSKITSPFHSPPSSSPLMSCNIILPGSEIPEWFSYQSIESSLTIHFPGNCHRVVGVAFCIVFALTKPLRSSWFKFGYHFKAYNGEQDDGEFFEYLEDLILDGEGHGLLKSDHMLLWYSNNFQMRKFNTNNKASFEINFGLIKHINVKKCGVHLRYDEDSCGDSDEEDYLESVGDDTNFQSDHDDYYSFNAEPSSGSGRSDSPERMELLQDGNSCFLCIQFLKEFILDLKDTCQRFLWTSDDKKDNWESMRDYNNLKKRLDDYCFSDPEASGSSEGGRSDDNPNKRIKLLQD